MTASIPPTSSTPGNTDLRTPDPTTPHGYRQTVRELLAQAARPEAAHEWEQAIALLTRALEALPGQVVRAGEAGSATPRIDEDLAAGEDVTLARAILDRRAECRRLRGDLAGAVPDLEVLALLAARQGDPAGQALADLRRAWVFSRLGRYDETLALAQTTLELARRLGDRCMEARSLAQIGIALVGRSEFAEARRHLEQGRDLARSTVDAACEGECL
jgi:tetratricopeptide (TPR) repeat protein